MMSFSARVRSGLIVLLVLVAGCTRTVNEGSYGPFLIGQSKKTVLSILEQKHYYYIEPKPGREIYISNPSRRTYDQFDNLDGLAVWLRKHPWPLRIEFSNDTVTKTWPDFASNKFAPVDNQEVETELARLRSIIPLGMKRAAVYDLLSGFSTPYPISVGNFVPGYQDFREKGIPVPWTDGFRALLMRSDAWEFEGLKEVLWWYDPYSSKVTLYFKGDKLERVHHWHFLTELP